MADNLYIVDKIHAPIAKYIWNLRKANTSLLWTMDSQVPWLVASITSSD